LLDILELKWRTGAVFSNRDETMRKIVILAGLLIGAALLSGTPAKAAVGCLCGKLGAPAVCTATVTDCNFKNGGVCISPCIMEEPKAGKKHKRHLRKKKK
jgi:hypothetical protein